MIFALLTLLGSSLCVSADNSTNYCPPSTADTNPIGLYLSFGTRFIYAQQRFGPPIVAEKCWRSSFFITEYNALDNSFNPIYTFYGPGVTNRNVQVKMLVIGNMAKFNLSYDGSGGEITVTATSVTTDYLVVEFCRGNEYSVVIFTDQPDRDETIIQTAIQDAQQRVSLPSPSVNMECDELVDETSP